MARNGEGWGGGSPRGWKRQVVEQTIWSQGITDGVVVLDGGTVRTVLTLGLEKDDSVGEVDKYSGSDCSVWMRLGSGRVLWAKRWTDGVVALTALCRFRTVGSGRATW